MICDHCENGLGQVTQFKLIDNKIVVVSGPCAGCAGVGFTCNRCGGNPAHCGCDDDPPRVVPQKIWTQD
jgi:hypothetical protein